MALRINLSRTASTSTMESKAGEPLAFSYQNANAAGAVQSMTGEAYVYALYKGGTREEIAYRDAVMTTDSAGDIALWVIPGTVTEGLYGQGALKWEIARRLDDGRDVIVDGTLNILESAPRIDDFNSAPVTQYIQKIVRKNDPETLASPNFTVTMAVYAPGGTPAPTNTVPPGITGTPNVGSTLTASNGTWTGSPTFTRQWLRGGTAISGATGTTYVVQAADQGNNLSVRVTATNSGGSVSVESATVAVAAPTPAPIFTTQPSMSPTSGTAGQTTFTASTGTASNASSYTRRWLLNGSPIGTGTTVQPASAGNLVLEVTATGPGGSTTATSTAVAVAAAPVPAPAFTTQPSMSPTSGTAGTTTFTASDGSASNASGYSRRWLLDGSSIGTGPTVTPSTAGSLVLEVTATGAGGSATASSAASTIAAAPSAPISSVNANGWSAEYANPASLPAYKAVGLADFTDTTVTVQRLGFDGSASPISRTVEMPIYKRVRQVWSSGGNQLNPTPSTVALADYVYNNNVDTIPGVTNNSTEFSPKPKAAWVMNHKRVVANTLHLEVVAFHRNAQQGRQVACVRFTASDGSNSVSATVNACTLSANPRDAQPLPVYQTDLNISTLAEGLITVNAEVFPWVGDANSVARSADLSNVRDFSPRYFLKNIGRATNPPLAYVAQSGGSASGTISTDAATAKANPFDTITNALAALNSAYASTTGIDGCEVRCLAGTHVIGNTGTRTTRVCGPIITRDPAATKEQVVLTWGAAVASWSLNTGYTTGIGFPNLVFRGITFTRTGASFMQAPTGTFIETQFEDCLHDTGGQTGAAFARFLISYDGLTLASSTAVPILRGATNNDIFLTRGVNGDLVDGYWQVNTLVACRLVRPRVGETAVLAGTNYVNDGYIVFQNKLLNPNPSVAVLSSAQTTEALNGDVIRNVWIVQNLFELTRNGSQTMLRLNADTPTYGQTENFGVIHNTFTGYFGHGRYNLIYDSTLGGYRRNHRLHTHRNDIVVQLNNKGDVFLATSGNEPANAPLATGQFAYHHGVGCSHIWTQFQVGAGPGLSENQNWPGKGSVIGGSQSVRNDPLFVDYRGFNNAGDAPGGGDYRLQSGSPCRAAADVLVLNYDLDGNPRAGALHSLGAFN